MAKNKKKSRKLRKQIRKTIGALLMVSAIVVAAIPVQETQASNTDPAEWVRCLNYTSNISTPGISTIPANSQEPSPFNSTNFFALSLETSNLKEPIN